MALTTANYRESTSTNSWYDQTFRSTYDLELKPQTLGEMIYRYGDGLSVLNFINLGGGEMKPVKSETITVFERGAPTRPVTVSIGTSADASAGVTVTPASGDDSDDYLRAGFDLIVPKEYTDQDQDVPLRLSYSSPTWTGTPYTASVKITTALSEVVCFVGASSMGRGSAGVDPMSSGSYSYTTKARIFRDAAGVDGGVIFQEEYEEVNTADGGKGLWSKALAEMDFRLDDQIDSALLTSVENTNTSNLVATSNGGGNSHSIPSFNGLVAEMIAKGQPNNWTSEFDIDKFRATKTLLENVGIINKKVDFLVGTDLNASIETSMRDWLVAYSAGHSFYDEMSKVGFVVKEVTTNGVQFYINELASFANPNKFGLSSYGYRNMGFMFPQGKYSVDVDQLGGTQKMRIPHLTLGYPNNYGENRKRIYSVEPGVNGLSGLGGVVSNSYDAVKWHLLAHVVPIFAHMHQTILVQKTAAEGGGS